MKKIILLTAFMVLFASSAWSLYIFNEGYVNVGDLDNFIAAATKDQIGGDAGDQEELNWINLQLGTDYTMEEFTKIETDDGSGWEKVYEQTDPDVYVEKSFTFAYDFDSLSPDYFLIKTGNLQFEGDDRWFLFDNSELLDWAVVNLWEYYGENYSILSMGKISHLGTVAPVPEPGTLLLIGSGLIGLAGIRKKFARAD